MFVYLIRCEENNLYKIGYTKNVENRIKQLQTGNGDKIYLVYKYESDIANKIEKPLHKFYSHANKLNEWFELYIEDEVDFIKKCEKIEKNIKYLTKNKI